MPATSGSWRRWSAGSRRSRPLRGLLAEAAAELAREGDRPSRRGQGRHHGRGAGGGDHRRQPGPGGRLHGDRHQRPDPVLPGGRPQQPQRRRASTSRSIRRFCACYASSSRARTRPAFPVSLCGEMGADAQLLPLLVGLGLRRVSASPSAIPALRLKMAGIRAERRGAAWRRPAAPPGREPRSIDCWRSSPKLRGQG